MSQDSPLKNPPPMRRWIATILTVLLFTVAVIGVLYFAFFGDDHWPIGGVICFIAGCGAARIAITKGR